MVHGMSSSAGAGLWSGTLREPHLPEESVPHLGLPSPRGKSKLTWAPVAVDSSEI